MSLPYWQRLAEAGYTVLLRCYPRGIRERHGEEMRQAFRDRCREVAAGRTSAWRLLSLEIAPDFATSLAGAHFDAPESPRQRTALLCLLVLGAVWLFQGALSERFLDGYFALSLRWQHWRDERALAHDEAQVRTLGDTLANSPDDADRSLAAYLYAIDSVARSYTATYVPGAQGNLPFLPLSADGERATKLLATIPLATDARSARTAFAACRSESGCDRLARAQALVRAEPRNAFGWSQLLKLHSIAGDEAAVRRDLASLARAGYYEDGRRDTRRQLAAAALRFGADDAALAGALGRQLVLADWAMLTDDFGHDLWKRCALQPVAPTWLSQHPEARSDCRRAAVLYANSGSGWASAWGWRWLDRDQPSALTAAGRRAAEARAAEPGNFGTVPLGERRWRPWTDAEWLDWARSQAAATVGS